MRKLFVLLALALGIAAFAVTSTAVAGGNSGGGNNGGHPCNNGQHTGDKHCPGNGDNGGCKKNCGPPPCNNTCPPPCNNTCPPPCNNTCPPTGPLGSPKVDCEVNRLGTYVEVDGLLYACLFPKNNGPAARAKSTLICETPDQLGGQGGTAVDVDGLAFICIGPSGDE